MLRPRRIPPLRFAAPLLLVLLCCCLLVPTTTSAEFIRMGTRKLQEPTSISSYSDAAFMKCYDILDGMEGALPELSQSSYIEFLSDLENNDNTTSVASDFRDLDAAHVMLFHFLACTEPDSCGADVSTPSINLGTTSNPTDDLDFFCKVMLKLSETSTEASFEYSIRYNEDRIEESALASCLAIATVNVLLERVADCETLTDIIGGNAASRQRRQRQLLESLIGTHVTNIEINDRSLQNDAILGDANAPATSDCRYNISSSVIRIANLPCDDNDIDVSNGVTATNKCGLVRQSVSVAAPQIVEPYAELLRVQVVSVLRDVINGGEFVNYFPPEGCFL